MRINHNIAALNTYNKLSSNQAATAKSLEKLSSGLKINKAGDNAAGLAISEKMRGQIRGLDQAATNANDAISLINTAEGALGETHSILQRMRELAVQSSNDTNVTVDRGEIQKEMNQLTSEINRIGNTTEFNTQKLLNGGGSKVTSLESGIVTTVMGGEAGKISAITNTKASETGKSTISFNANGKTYTFQGASGVDLSSKTITFANGGTVAATSVSGTGNNVTITLGSGDVTTTAINDLIASGNIFGEAVTLTVTDTTTGANAGTIVSGDRAAMATVGLKTFSTGGSTPVNGVYKFDITQAFSKAGDTISFNLATSASNPDQFTKVTLTANLTASSGTAASTGTFRIGSGSADLYDADRQATEIVKALKDGALNAAYGGIYDIRANGSEIIFTEKTAIGAGNAQVSDAVATSTANLGVSTYTHTDANVVKTGGSFIVGDKSIAVVDGAGEEDNVNIANGTAIKWTSGDDAATQAGLLRTALTTSLNGTYTVAGVGANIQLTQTAASASREAPEMSISDAIGSKFEANFQIGANSKQSMTIEVDDMRSAALKISSAKTGTVQDSAKSVTASYVEDKDVTNGTTKSGSEYALDVSTHEKATAAISIINDAIQTVSAERSKLGSFQNRLEHTINNLSTSSENMSSAESRIRDVDMAKEMMEFTKNNILSQAAQSMLAQANQQPQGVLQLLQ